MFSVAIYLVDRKYGGPEEGGWWYTAGVPCDDVIEGMPIEIALVRYFIDEKEAIAYMETQQEWLDANVNKGRQPISSVLSDGQYWSRIEEGHPAPFPSEGPHYE